MGCFDTLHFKCPNCKKITSEQSKAGECAMANFTLENAPLSVISSINNQGNEGKLYCEHCNTNLELEVRFVAYPKIKTYSDSENGWRIV